MSGTWRNFGWQANEIPREPLDETTRQAKDLPRTLTRVPGRDVTQRPVFEPALKHYQNAYRATDPVFTDPARGEAWRAARRRAQHLVLAGIAASPWADALVLRGSLLMSAWFGEAAREPGDLDFVVVPAAWRIEEERTEQMFAGVAEAAEAHGDEVRFYPRTAVVEDIWTYDRVPGRRMVLPWSAPGLPGGHVQLDFVFNEPLPDEPEPLELPGGAVLLAATPALSLVWKLMWLLTDVHGQGKDLYDAVLLAEHHPLSRELLHEVFRLSGEWPYPYRQKILLEDIVEVAGEVEWNHFATEYPQFTEREREFAERLVRAVTPAFDDVSEGGGTPRL
ncbi:nucleotidyl transferase AbiEii/AbiGii toxin family protein [Streptomyces sp. NPDC001410]|uniref:nucleotidyl transferase AbiEii/AbiGii toxin family protein n=1 Tax=Streptomyces sp. NPDC001410 TaxID=3364574 RepID=UPI00369F967A